MKKDFLWGVSTAAYQIEGAFNEDGKAPSVWDNLTHDGRAFRKQNADVSCDHYHRYKEDVKLMAELGVKVYRFSVAWSRIISDKFGTINSKGLEFYSNLVDELLKYGIEPFVTLYHWDMPEFIEMQGGFVRRGIVADFNKYVQVVVKTFGDRVKYYNTINEPQCVLDAFCDNGLTLGKVLTKKYLLQSMHNLLLCHGIAVKTIRELNPTAKVGFVTCGWVPVPVKETEKNIKAAYDKFFSLDVEHPVNGMNVICDAVYLGDYPKEYYTAFADILPDIQSGDMELISQPLDYIGQNTYSGYFVDENGNTVDFADGSPMNNCGWDDIPQEMYWVLRFLSERYKLPIIITENGYSQNDRICLDGKVHDSYRIDMTTRYLQALKRAVAEGIQVDGYFHWSLMDNFEWHGGYNQRFGLVFVDYQTLKRTPKDSFYFYKQVIETNGDNV